MTTVSPAPGTPTHLAGWLYWALADGWTITRRDLAHWARQPWELVFSLLFPIMMVCMFGFLFGGAIQVPGGGDYREFLMPGMFAMTMLFGVGETVTAITTDIRAGVTDRFRSLPMASSAVVSGRATADLLRAVVVLLVLIGCGLLVGWRINGSPGAAVLAVALVLLLRFALTWVGIYLGLVLRGQDSLSAVQTLEFPIGFLSNAFVAVSTMPAWLGTLAEWNPLSSTVSATRQLFGNPGWDGSSWIAQHSLLMAVVWPLLLCAIFFPLSVRRYRALSS